jgi:LPXTG-motif cell wall-anchored protein
MKSSPRTTTRRASQSEKIQESNMKLLKTLGTLLCLAALCAFVVPAAIADDWNRKTTLTFSGPVEVPGVGAQILPAGTYVFKILNSQSDRHIVQIFNKEETHLFTTILAIPNYRLKTTDKTVITFSERPAGQPEALKAWFYPGREWGEEFVYSKSRAMELAKETNEPVLATPVEMEAAPIEALNTAPVVAVAPTGEPVELSQVVEPPPAAAAKPVAAEPVTMAAAEPVAAPAAELPKTASSLPLIALIGLLTLSAGFALSVFSKRSV